MQITIKSEKAEAIIDSFGAELHSLKDNAETEYLWQADPAVWKRHAPVLFPFICNTDSKKYTYEGQVYSLANHGFARDSEFELVSSDGSSAEFLLKSSTETLKLYPFEFELRIGYKLAGNKLDVSYTVKNTDTKDMYFFIGGHPAFNVPMGGESYSDYFVEYEKPETIVREFKGKTEIIADNTSKIPLSHEIFADDVFMKDAPASSWIALVSKKSGRKIKLNYDTKCCIAVWSSYFEDKAVTEQAKFVCLEPWSSVPVYCDKEEDITKMSRAIKLAPGNKYAFAYSIEIS